MIGTLLSNACQTFPRLTSLSPIITNPWSLILSRTNVRHHFPRPNEGRRIKRHGWDARMSTLSGRKILMRRILKGKYVLSH